MTPVVLTVNAGSSSLQLHLVRDGRVLLTEHSEQSPDPAEAERTLSDFLAKASGLGSLGGGPGGPGGVGGGTDSGRDNPDGAAEGATAGGSDGRGGEDGRLEVGFVGHRLVHGGDAVLAPTVVDDDVLQAVGRYADLAPLHVPPALALVEAARRTLPTVPHVLCPDTAFHAGMPEAAATYPLPSEWRRRYGLRRYGFHGLSYAWAVRRAAELLDRPVEGLDLVMTHLGGGSSVCAIRGGRSVDTSMGFTPLEGVPMSKRSGSVDPGMLLWLLSDSRLSLEDLREGLEHRSGLLGLSDGLSGDTRELVASKEKAAALALDVFVHRVSREIAAATANLDRFDALVFTGEIGWDQPEVREGVCRRLSVLGLEPPVRGDPDTDGFISPAGARVPVLVVKPREELQVARETLAVFGHPT